MGLSEPRGDGGIGDLEQRGLVPGDQVFLSVELTAERRKLNVFVLESSV